MSEVIGYTMGGTPFSEIHECPYCGAEVYKYEASSILPGSRHPQTLRCQCCGSQFDYGYSTRIEW